MQTKILILTEGIADIIFLRDYLIFLDSNLKLITKKIKNELVIKSENKEIKIKAIGGYTNLEMQKTTFDLHQDDGFNILVIQDADNPDKSHGGVTDRVNYLIEMKEKLSVNFKTFLFPNNLDDGDLETLLLKIVKSETYDLTDECYSTFIKKEEELKLGFADELKENKGRIFNYFRAYYGMENAKENKRVYSEDCWNFKNEYLNDLFCFFEDNNIISK